MPDPPHAIEANISIVNDLITKDLDTPKTAASFLHVLPFTTLASSVNGKTSKKSVPKRRGVVWCV